MSENHKGQKGEECGEQFKVEGEVELGDECGALDQNTNAACGETSREEVIINQLNR